MLQLEFDPDGFFETVGGKLGLVERRAKGDPKRFEELIEGRGAETGPWPGEVDQDHG